MSNIKHRPTTLLPYQVVEENGVLNIASELGTTIMPDVDTCEYAGAEADELRKDFRYIAHAANAYPKLVLMLREAAQHHNHADMWLSDARAVLSDLGEDA